MPGKKKPRVSDHRKTKNPKQIQKSNSVEVLTRNQVTFFKAKYLTLVTEIYINYLKNQIGYKKVGASIKNLIAADIALQYLEKHCMNLTFQTASCESSNDLKRKFTDIWIARKLQIRGKRDVIHGLVDARKNNRFNIGFHGAIVAKNNVNNNDNEDLGNKSQKNSRISKKGSTDFIKPLNIEKNNDDQHDVKTNSSSNSPKLKRRKKKNNLQQPQEIENNPKSSKENSRKSPKNQFDYELPPQNQQKINLKKKKTKKEEIDNFDSNDNDEDFIKPQQKEFQIIESPIKKVKSNFSQNNQYQNDDENNNYNNSDNFNDDIDLNELPPPLGTDSSDDNDEIFDMNGQYNYNVVTADNIKSNDNFYKAFDDNDDNDENQNKHQHHKPSKLNDKNEDFNNGFNKNANYNIFDDKKDKHADRFDYKPNDFEDEKDNLGNDSDKDIFIRKPNNETNNKKESKSGKTRTKSLGSHPHIHTNSGHNSNNASKTKPKPKNNLNEVSHFYTYTYEEEDEYSESTQYEYPTHIYEYEDFEEEEEKKYVNKKPELSSNNYIKNKEKNKPNHEDSLITGEIEIQTQEIEDLNPILPLSSKNNSIEKPKKNKNKIPNADNSYPSSGSPQNHSTSSNSLHEQKIKLTLQQNVEMIQNEPQEEKKQTKLKGKSKSKSNSKENTQIQEEEEESSVTGIQLIFETFHTVDVQPNPELQRLFKQRKGNKQKQKEISNNDSSQNNLEQVYFPLQNNANNSKIKENQNKKVQQLEPIQKKVNDSENGIKIPQNPTNIHIKIVEAIIFKNSGFETNIFKVRIKLASAKEFAETKESTPSAIQQSPDSNQLIAHHLWDEAFKILCNTIENEEIIVSVLALRNKKQQKQRLFDIVSTTKIGLKSFVIDEISDVWINMKNIGRIHLLVCIKNFNPNEEEFDVYEEEEEEEEEAEMSGNEEENE